MSLSNVGPLTEEIAAALSGRWTFELVFVNDGSADGTQAALTALKAERPWLRQVRSGMRRRAACGDRERGDRGRSRP